MLEQQVGKSTGKGQEAGQGKGAAKGQDQGTGKDQGKVKAKWACLRKGCKKSEGGALNNASRLTCFCCGHDKGACMSPPAGLCRTTCQDALKLNEQEAEEAGAQEVQAGTAPQAKAAAKATGKPPKAEPTAVAALPAPKALTVEVYIKSRTAAPPTVTVKTAEECLLGAAPRDKAVELAQARDDVAYLTDQLAEAKKGAQGSARLARVPALQVDLDQASVKVEKCAASAPARACSTTLLQNAVTDYEHLTSTRKASWLRGAAKALAAEEEVVEEIQAHIKEWQAYLASLQEDARVRKKDWATYQTAATAAMVQVSVALKERHAAAVTLASGGTGAPPPGTSGVSAAAGAASASSAAAGAASAPTVLSSILPIVELPAPVQIEEAELDAYALLQRVLEHHSMQDVDFPLAFGNVPLPHTTIAKLVGAQLWTDAYPKGAPKELDFINRRILGALKVAVNRMAIAHEAFDKVDEAKVLDMVNVAGKQYDHWRSTQSGAY